MQVHVFISEALNNCGLVKFTEYTQINMIDISCEFKFIIFLVEIFTINLSV